MMTLKQKLRAALWDDWESGDVWDDDELGAYLEMAETYWVVCDEFDPTDEQMVDIAKGHALKALQYNFDTVPLTGLQRVFYGFLFIAPEASA